MSNTNVSRKQYVIAYGDDDILHYNGLNSEPVGLLPEGLKKFTDTITGVDLLRMLSPNEQFRRSELVKGSRRQYLLLTRRAAARRVAKILNEKRYHSREDFRIIEIGSTPREVRPVKHWNIERRYRNTLGAKPTPWSEPETWSRGIETREAARRSAAEKTKIANAHDRDNWEYKFTAVPVYA